jgi:hypothetical protein
MACSTVLCGIHRREASRQAGLREAQSVNSYEFKFDLQADKISGAF